MLVGQGMLSIFYILFYSFLGCSGSPARIFRKKIKNLLVFKIWNMMEIPLRHSTPYPISCFFFIVGAQGCLCDTTYVFCEKPMGCCNSSCRPASSCGCACPHRRDPPPSWLHRNQAWLPISQACFPKIKAWLPITHACFPKTQAWVLNTQAWLP